MQYFYSQTRLQQRLQWVYDYQKHKILRLFGPKITVTVKTMLMLKWCHCLTLSLLYQCHCYNDVLGKKNQFWRNFVITEFDDLFWLRTQDAHTKKLNVNSDSSFVWNRESSSSATNPDFVVRFRIIFINSDLQVVESPKFFSFEEVGHTWKKIM